MHPILISLGPFTIFSYGAMVALGFLGATLWAYYQSNQQHKDNTINPTYTPTTEQILSLILTIIITAMIGARVFYIIQFWPQFQDNYWQILNLRGGGLVFYGGLITGIPALVLFCKKNQLSILQVLDLAAPATMLGYAIGRLGCLLNGCCYGQRCNLPWAIQFPHDSVTRHPTQIYSSLVAFILFTILWHIYCHKKYSGQVIYWALISHSIYRFCIEFLRENPLYYNLSSAQWIAILIIVITSITFKKITISRLSH